MRRFAIFCLLMLLPVSAFARTPNDPYYDEQWYLEQIHAPEAWDTTVGSRQLVVAVLDVGVDLDHPDIEDQIWTNFAEVPGDELDNDDNGFVDDVHGWDFVDDDAVPEPDASSGFDDGAFVHGTIVSGVLGAEGDNDEGIAGVAWKTRIMSIRILDGLGAGDTGNVAAAIDYAVDNGADIINLSFTGTIYDPSVERAVREAYRQGVFIVAAIGNADEGGFAVDEEPIYPACLSSPLEDWVFGVAATDENDEKADFSNYGASCVDLSAPGVDVFGTLWQKDDTALEEFYGGGFNGTSVATPQVVGAVVLLKTAYPDLSVADVQLALKLSADPISLEGTDLESGDMGAGRLNVDAALDAAQFIIASGDFGEEEPIFEVPETWASVVGALPGSPPIVRVEPEVGESIEWFAYAEGFLGGVNISVGDVNGDGESDVVTGAGEGGGPHVRIFSLSGELLGQFFAFDTTRRNGVWPTIGDVDGDGSNEIVVIEGQGGSGEMRIFTFDGIMKSSFSVSTSPAIRFETSVADTDADGQDEIVVASGPGVSPEVRLFSSNGVLQETFFPYAPSMTAGLYVAAGDLNGDGLDEVVTGTGDGAGPQVQIWTMGETPQLTGQFFAYEESFRGGVIVSVGDIDADGVEEIVTLRGDDLEGEAKVFDQFGQEQL